MPRDRLTGRRGIGRPGIQSGGFTGGAYVRPEGPGESPLLQLGSTLGALSDATNRGIMGYADAQAQKKAAADELLQEDAIGEANSARLAMSALNAQERAKYIAEGEFAKKLEDNPYILPMIEKYEGQRQAQEAWEAMVESGVDITDDEQVQNFLAQAIEGRDGEHFAAGFNQEWGRVQAQITQQTVASATSELRNRMTNAAAELLFTSLEDGMSATDAFKTLKTEDAFQGMSGKELTGIQMIALERAARAGNVELATEIANADRGDAPALLNSSEAGRVQMFLQQAQSTASQQRTEFLEQYLPQIGDAIAAGMTIEQLEQHPAYASFSPERKNSLRSQIRARDEKARKEYNRRATNAAIRETETEYKVGMAAGVINGTVDEILPLDQDFIDADGNSRSVSVTERAIRNQVTDYLRGQVFSEGVAATDPRLAVSALTNTTNAGVRVPGFVKAAYSDIARDFDPDRIENLENLDDDEVSNLLGILTGADPSLRSDILSEGAAVWETAVALQSSRPGMSPKELLTYAARIKSNPMTTNQIDGFNKTIDTVAQFSPDNIVGKGKAKFSVGQLNEYVARPEVQAELLDRVAGLQPDEIEGVVESFVSSRFAPVHGSLVEMPAVQGETYINQEIWANSVDSWITTQAEALEAEGVADKKKLLKKGNVRVRRLPGVQGDYYQVTFVDQDESFQMRAPGITAIRNAVRIQGMQIEEAQREAEEEAARNKAANTSRKRARRRKSGRDDELVDILTD